jgi:MoxR-like ATPase
VKHFHKTSNTHNNNKKGNNMFATILQSTAHYGVRQTAVVPMTDKVRVFTRLVPVGGKARGIAGAWAEVEPLFDTPEYALGQPVSIQVTINDARDLQYPITPTTLLQKLVRTTVGNNAPSEERAIAQYAEVYETARTNAFELAKYTKPVAFLSNATVVAPAIQVVHAPEVVEPVLVGAPAVEEPSVMEVLEQLADEFMSLSTTEREQPMTMTTTVAPQASSAEAILTVPDAKPYFERTFDGVLEEGIYDYARKTQQNVLLTGDAGTGKTSSARNYAATHNLPFVTIECTQQIDQSITQGRFVPTGVGNSTQWKYSQLATAIQRPSVILINELTRMTPKAASLFLRLLEERELLIEPLNEVIKVHPDVLFVADQNTGIGYTGTSKQDAALVDRFNLKLEFQYDTKIESKFIKSPALLQFATDIRTASEMNDEFSVPMSSRILQNFQAQAVSLNFQFAVNSMMNNYPKSDGEREAIKMRFDAVHHDIATELKVEIGSYSGK